MTLAIGVVGPQAGKAVFDAMQAVEKIASGSIGGFVTFVAIDAQGQIFRAETQRGGSRTLFSDGTRLLTAPPSDIAACEIAGVITSGPDRPDPLSKFIAAAPNVGLVTGHRSPHTKGVNGMVLNQDVLSGLIQGETIQQSVDRVLDANPQCDAGFIAIDCSKNMYSRNSKRVDSRPDVGQWQAVSPDGATRVHVLHNAMTPHFYRDSLLSHLAAEIALETSVAHTQSAKSVTLVSGLTVEAGAEDAVYCDKGGRIVRIVTADTQLLKGHVEAAVLYLGTPVMAEGQYLGKVNFEPIVTMEDGVVIHANAMREVQIKLAP